MLRLTLIAIALFLSVSALAIAGCTKSSTSQNEQSAKDSQLKATLPQTDPNTPDDWSFSSVATIKTHSDFMREFSHPRGLRKVVFDGWLPSPLVSNWSAFHQSSFRGLEIRDVSAPITHFISLVEHKRIDALLLANVQMSKDLPGEFFWVQGELPFPHPAHFCKPLRWLAVEGGEAPKRLSSALCHLSYTESLEELYLRNIDFGEMLLIEDEAGITSSGCTQDLEFLYVENVTTKKNFSRETKEFFPVLFVPGRISLQPSELEFLTAVDVITPSRLRAVGFVNPTQSELDFYSSRNSEPTLDLKAVESADFSKEMDRFLSATHESLSSSANGADGKKLTD